MQSYRNRHRELLRLATAIPLRPESIDPRAARHALEELRSLYAVHARLQDGMLFPWMLRQNSGRLKDKALEFGRATSETMRSLQSMSDSWPDAESIGANRHAFAVAWRHASDRLREHIDNEERNLYVTIETSAPVTA